MRYSKRDSKTGRFMRAFNVVPGRLYRFGDVVVRAKKKCNANLIMVSYHKKLNGFVRPSELSLISKNEVAEYIDSVPKTV